MAGLTELPPEVFSRILATCDDRDQERLLLTGKKVRDLVLDSNWASGSHGSVVYAGHVEAMTNITVHDNIVATASNDGSVKIWNKMTGNCLRVFESEGEWVHSVALHLDNSRVHVLSISRGQSFRVQSWDHVKGLLLSDTTIPVETTAATFANGMAVTGHGNGTVSTWDLEGMKCLHTLRGLEATSGLEDLDVDAVAVRGSLVAIGDRSGRVELWKLGGEFLLRLSDAHLGLVHSIVWTSSTTVATASADGVKVWELPTATLLSREGGDRFDEDNVNHGWSPVQLASRDKEVVMTCSDGKIRAWNPSAGSLRQVVEVADAALCATPSELLFDRHGSLILHHYGNLKLKEPNEIQLMLQNADNHSRPPKPHHRVVGEYLKHAMAAAKGRDVRVLHRFAVYLEEVLANKDQADAQYLKALSLASTQGNAATNSSQSSLARILLDYAMFLYEWKGDLEVSKKLLSKAFELDPSDPVVIVEYAGFLEGLEVEAQREHDMRGHAVTTAEDQDGPSVLGVATTATLVEDAVNLPPVVKLEEDEGSPSRLIYNALLALQPEERDRQILEHAELLLSTRRKFIRAERCFSYLARKESTIPHLGLCGKGRVAMAVGKMEVARVMLSRAVCAAFHDPVCLREYAVYVSLVEGDHDQADKLLRMACTYSGTSPDSARTYQLYAEFLENVRNETLRSLYMYRQSMVRDPRDSRVVGKFCALQSHLRGTPFWLLERHLTRALDHDPLNTNILLLSSKLALHDRESPNCVQTSLDLCQKAVEVSEHNNYNALIFYATLLASEVHAVDKAAQVLKDLVDRVPDNAYILLHYADFLSRFKIDLAAAEAIRVRARALEESTVVPNADAPLLVN